MPQMHRARLQATGRLRSIRSYEGRTIEGVAFLMQLPKRVARLLAPVLVCFEVLGIILVVVGARKMEASLDRSKNP
jgi:hypothetical protein